MDENKEVVRKALYREMRSVHFAEQSYIYARVNAVSQDVQNYLIKNKQASS